MDKWICVLFLVILTFGSLSRSEYRRSPAKEFSLFDDDDESGDNEDSEQMSSDEEEQLVNFLLHSGNPFESRNSFDDMLNEELLDDSQDVEEEDPVIAILKLGYRFTLKLNKRSKHLDTISDEFNKFVRDGFVISNHWFNLLAKLEGEEGVNYEFRETILNMMAQAERNIESIHKVTGLYKETVIDDEDGLGRLETIPAQFNKIASRYEDGMDDLTPQGATVSDSLESLKGDVSRTVEKEKNILRLFRIFMEEQLNLITLGKKLWVNTQENYDKRYDEDDVFDDLTGGIKQNPTNEDILKQILEVRRTRRAISAYSQFLERKGNLNETSVKKGKKDEL